MEVNRVYYIRPGKESKLRDLLKKHGPLLVGALPKNFSNPSVLLSPLKDSREIVFRAECASEQDLNFFDKPIIAKVEDQWQEILECLDTPPTNNMRVYKTLGETEL